MNNASYIQWTPKTSTIVTYAPTNVSDDEEVKNYHHQFTAATKPVPAHNVLIVVGDFNARIGLDNAKFAYHTSTNRNGEFLHEYAQENDLVITNTTFKKKTSKLWTHRRPNRGGGPGGQWPLHFSDWGAWPLHFFDPPVLK